jgi:hypothetical protein
MPRFLDRMFNLERSDDPRRVPVGANSLEKRHVVRSTPGARVRLPSRDRDAQAQLALLWCVRNDVAVEFTASAADILLDGASVTVVDLIERMSPPRR